MSTYEQFIAGKTQIRHSKCGELVLGFEVCVDRENFVLYALNTDGQIKKAEIGSDRVHFNRRGREWTAVDEIPGDAVFVGNYAKDMF